MSLVRACTRAELPEGTVKQVDVGGKPVALCNAGGAIHALGGVCPHVGGPIGDGFVEEPGVIRCPWHGWGFEVATGKCLNVPRAALPVYRVEVQGEDVLVDVAPPG